MDGFVTSVSTGLSRLKRNILAILVTIAFIVASAAQLLFIRNFWCLLSIFCTTILFETVMKKIPRS